MPLREKAEENPSTKYKVLHAAAVLFLQNGYEKTTVREVAEYAGVNRGSVVFAAKSKENLLAILVEFVLDGQFAASKKIVEGKTTDGILYYAAETVLQLYMAESREQVRELYAAAYALPNTADIIYKKVSEKLEPLFAQYNPTWEAKDFFEREIASGSIIRGYMAKPCDMYFTMERKVRVFLDVALRIYNVPDEKIKEAIDFVSAIDFEAIAAATIESMITQLKNKF